MKKDCRSKSDEASTSVNVAIAPNFDDDDLLNDEVL
jgi:hypothetical protein